MDYTEDRFSGKRKKGSIEVIAGPMFSGKTEELIRRLKRARLAKLSVEIFKPIIDKRYSEFSIVSHDQNSLDSVSVENSNAIYLLSSRKDVIGIDEAQFFDPDIVRVCEKLASKGVKVIIAGLDMDYLGMPFGPMPQLMATAEKVTKLNAVCVNCGEPATHSYRKVDIDDKIMIGEMDSYEPRCRTCFNLGSKIPKSQHSDQGL